MNCQRVQRHLSASRAGQLSAWRARQLAAHLEHCPACRAENDQLQRLDVVLGAWTVTAEPRAGFEQRVWNRIRAAERAHAPTTWTWWLRPTWLLSAASAAALAMVAISGAVAHQRADAVAKQRLFASVGLDQLDNFPAGSLAAAYFQQP